MTRLIKAIFASFIGVRAQSDLEKDAKYLKLWQIIITGVLLAATLVLTIILFVNLIV